MILSQSSLGGRWMIDFHITKLTTEFIVQWISKTRRFNPRLGQKSNPIHLKNWKIIMQSKLGTIGLSVQPSKLQPGLRTVFSTLYSQPVQPSKLRIIPFQPVLEQFSPSLLSLLATLNLQPLLAYKLPRELLELHLKPCEDY